MLKMRKLKLSRLKILSDRSFPRKTIEFITQRLKSDDQKQPIPNSLDSSCQTLTKLMLMEMHQFKKSKNLKLRLLNNKKRTNNYSSINKIMIKANLGLKLVKNQKTISKKISVSRNRSIREISVLQWANSKQLNKKVNEHLIRYPEWRLESHPKTNRFLPSQEILKAVKNILKGDSRSCIHNMIQYSKSQSSNAKKQISAIRGYNRKTYVYLGSIVRQTVISKEKMIGLNCYKHSMTIVFSNFLNRIRR